MVDDVPEIVELLDAVFSESGWSVTTASSGAEGIEALAHSDFDVILTDLMMPENSGIDLLRASKEFRPDTEVILMTGYAAADTAIEAMRIGAFHYIVKPLKVEEVRNLADKAWRQRQLLRENRFLKSEVRSGYQINTVVGDSAAINQVVAAAQAVAPMGNPLLVVGEPGSGRRFFARFIHFCGPRAEGLFVPVNCAGMTPDRIALELFGHSAREGRSGRGAGRIEMANNGTLFLSNIEEADLKTLERLANFIETKSLRSAGENTEISLDVRIIASSSLSLDELKNRGAIPPDLASLFEPGVLKAPPLRERKEDIPFLLHHFLEEANLDRKKPLKGFTSAALSILEPYDWPGNVTELARFVRAVAAKKKQGTMIDASDIPPEIIYRRPDKQEPAE